MTAERKILIVMGVVILALAVFGFTKKEHYDYSGKHGPGFGQPSNAPAYEYAVTYFETGSHPQWGEKHSPRRLQDHLNMMGAQGWALVNVQQGNFSDEHVLFFTRPVAQWR